RPVKIGMRKGANFSGFRRSPPEVAHGTDQLRIAVVGGVGADQAACARRQASHLNGNLDSLGAAATEYDALDAVVMESGVPLCERNDAFVQVTTVDIEGSLLPGHGCNDGRVGVPDDRDVVVHVDVASPVPVEQKNSVAPDDLERVVVEQLRAGPQGTIPAIAKRP